MIHTNATDLYLLHSSWLVHQNWKYATHYSPTDLQGFNTTQSKFPHSHHLSFSCNWEKSIPNSVTWIIRVILLLLNRPRTMTSQNGCFHPDQRSTSCAGKLSTKDNWAKKYSAHSDLCHCRNTDWQLLVNTSHKEEFLKWTARSTGYPGVKWFRKTMPQKHGFNSSDG